MVKGRKLGSSEIGLEDMAIIQEMTSKGCSRKEISKKINRCPKTIYLWQKKICD